jgi:hypothetical protein
VAPSGAAQVQPDLVGRKAVAQVGQARLGQSAIVSHPQMQHALALLELVGEGGDGARESRSL